jgi:hypothetical protein
MHRFVCICINIKKYKKLFFVFKEILNHIQKIFFFSKEHSD